MNLIESNVFYCTICQYAEEALPNSYRVKPYVNEIVVVYNKPINKSVEEEFIELGATLHYVDWKEHFSYKRTQYIRKSGEIIEKVGDICGYSKDNTWMIISDTDEFLSIETLKNIKNLIAKAEINKSTICTINSHDIIIKGEGTDSPFTFIPRPIEEIDKNEIISQNTSNYFKELLVKYQDKLEYRGKVHHTLSGSGLRIMQLSKNYWYDHIKKDADLHSHGCRNWFIGGGGVQEFCEKWKVLRSITDKFNIDSWEKMENYMKIGNLHSDILQFIIDHKDDNDTPQDSELRSFYSYYKILHPKELENIIQTVKTIVTKEGIKSPISKLQNNEINNKKNSDLYYDPTWRKESGDKEIKSLIVNNGLIGDYDPDWKTELSEDIESFTIENNNNDYLIDDKEYKIKEHVNNTYQKIFGRDGDEGGIHSYTEQIIKGIIKKDELSDIFRKSDEYIQKSLET